MPQTIKFAHLADLHLGSFREKKLTKLNFKTFEGAISKIIDENLSFVLFSGDIFNNPMPPIEIVIEFTNQIKRLKEKNISLYVIGGSHDYSISGKSYIQLLDETGILKDVFKTRISGKNQIDLIFTRNDALRVNIAGILGKKNGLDKNIYSNLTSQNLPKDYLNIFMFHTTLNDFKPGNLNAKSEVDTSFLPKGFNYYAGGHIHKFMSKTFTDNSIISYSGALFPNNFKELKEDFPSFNLCEFDFVSKRTYIRKIILRTYEKEYIKICFNNQNPIEARAKIEESLEKIDVENKIVLIELEGTIDGKISDVNINHIIASLYERGAFQILKNTYKLKSSLIEVKDENMNLETKDVEEQIIKEQLEDKKDFDKHSQILKNLLKLDLVKQEGEKVAQYEERVCEEIGKVVKVN